MAASLSKFTQENTLTLLCFDESNFSLARNAVTPKLFDHPYREIAEKCIDYIDRYNAPPKDHIADEIEPLLAGEEGEKYRNILASLFSLKQNLNSKYVVEKLTEFVRDRNFEEALYTSAELHSKGKTEEAQEVMRNASNFNLSLFDAGIKVTDLSVLAKSLEEEEIFPTGIQALDDMKVGPARGQVFLILAPLSEGKSHCLVQMGKIGALTGLKVAHISLEISKEVVLQRYIQSLLGLTRWQYGAIKSPMFVRDGNNEWIRTDQAIIEPRSMDEPDILTHIEAGLKKFGPRLDENLRIKDFPSGSLTISGLRAYLDGLERTQNFIPDVTIIDNAINMKLPVEDYRLSLDRLMINLRGYAAERNMAVASAHHINREGAKSRGSDNIHVSESWGVLGIVDTAVIYSRTKMEQKHKIARLLVSRARSQRSRFTVMLAQNYDLCMFCLDSISLPNDYDPQADFGESGNVELVPD